MKELGSYLKKERLARNITVDQLSEAILIAPRIINDIESGDFSRYQGDEQYVRMYIKKYANYLGLDGDELGNRYLSLTRELSLKDIEEAKKKAEDKKTVNKSLRTFSSNTASRPTVYEDKRYVEYIKYIIAALLVVAIIFLVWFGFLRSAEKEQPFTPPVTPDVSGNVDLNPEDDENNQQDDQNNEDNQGNIEDINTVVFTKNTDLDYTFEVGDATEFTLKIEFYNRSWSQLWVNGQVYSGFKSKIYNNSSSSTPEVVELTFKVDEFNNLQLNNGYNKGTRYYINGEELVLSDNEQIPGSVKLKMALKKG